MLFDNPAMLVIGAIAPIALLAAIRYWQHALLSVFVLLVFEGALRKWAFPGAQAQIYFVKDVMLLAAYLGFVLDGRKDQTGLRGVASIRFVLILSVLFGSIEIVNPNSPSILVWLVGMKSYFLYAPIAFILPYAFKSQQNFLVLIRCYLIVAIPVAALGFVQIAAGPDSSLNAYVSHSEDAAALVHFGREYDLVRTSGTFSYISGYTAFLSFVGFLAIGYNLAQGWRIKNNMLPLLALTLVIGAMFTTGSRAPVYTLIAASPLIIWLATIGRVLAFRTAVRLFAVVPIVAFAALSISPRAFEAFVERATDPGSDSMLHRVLSPIIETSDALSTAPFFGMGIGTTHPSSLTIMGVVWPWWLRDMFTEVELARVTVELGVIGLLLTFALRILIAALALRWAMSFKAPVYRAFGIALAIHLALGVFGSIMLNATAGLYYWGALGLVLAMRRLEQSAGSEARIMIRQSRTKHSPSTVHAK
jgi:hypothetical protein